MYDLINQLNGIDLISYNIIIGSENQIYVTTKQGIYSLEKSKIPKTCFLVKTDRLGIKSSKNTLSFRG